MANISGYLPGAFQIVVLEQKQLFTDLIHHVQVNGPHAFLGPGNGPVLEEGYYGCRI